MGHTDTSASSALKTALLLSPNWGHPEPVEGYTYFNYTS